MSGIFLAGERSLFPLSGKISQPIFSAKLIFIPPPLNLFQIIPTYLTLYICTLHHIRNFRLYKPNKVSKKKSTIPVATDADYDRMNKCTSEANTFALAKEMGSKKFTFIGAAKQIMKNRCLVLYLRWRTSNEASAYTGVAKRTVFGWFVEFKSLYPIV